MRRKSVRGRKNGHSIGTYLLNTYGFAAVLFESAWSKPPDLKAVASSGVPSSYADAMEVSNFLHCSRLMKLRYYHKTVERLKLSLHQRATVRRIAERNLNDLSLRN